MTPGALAVRERVQPPSMTRVIASLVEMGLVDRTPHAVDRRQVMIAVSEAGSDLVTTTRQARQEWLTARLASLGDADRDVLRNAAALMVAMVDEGP